MYTTDKVGHGYVPVYQSIAQALGRSIVPGVTVDVLEVGVGDGSGMRMFADIFGGLVVGIDNDRPSVQRAQDAGLTVVYGDQTQPDTLPALAHMPPAAPQLYGVIVDDACHRAGETAQTFSALWPLVKPGGFYVIEDFNHLDHEVLHRMVLTTGIWAPKGSPQMLADVLTIGLFPEGLIVLNKRGRNGH